MKTAKKRLDWIDISKGIGILLVIIGHCLDLEKAPMQVIFVFHMPLFFILSGFVFSAGDGFGVFIKKRIRGLIIPYFVFFALGLFVTLLIPVWRQGLTVEGLLEDLRLADPSNIHNSSIWFLICLFIVQLIFFFLKKLPLWLRAVIVIALYAAGIVCANIIHGDETTQRLPLDLDVVPAALIFFAFGSFLKDRCSDRIKAGPEKNAVLICLIPVSAAILAAAYVLNGYVNMHGLRFGNPVLYLLGGISGTVLTVGITMLLSSSRLPVILELKEILLYYGKNSLLIMGIQSLLIRLYILIRESQGYKLRLYHFGASDSVICTVLVAFLCCPLICFIYTKALKPYLSRNGGIKGGNRE